ncbi:MAG: glycosyltransferase [Alphaproteobacteria bacterium]
MRILVLTKRQYMGKDLLDDRFGRFRELPLELARLGHTVSGITFSYRQRGEGAFSDAGESGDAGMTWHSVNLLNGFRPGIKRYVRYARAVMQNFQPDIVWACSDAYHAIFGYRLAQQFHAKCVIDLYDNFEAFKASQLPGALTLFRKSVRQAEGVTCFSAGLADYIARAYPRLSPTTVIENGVRTDLFYSRDRTESRRALGLPQNAKIIGTAGALDRSRGIDALFCAFDRLAADDSQIHLALAGPRKRGSRIPAGPRVHDFQNMPHEKVGAFINALDLAVICYRDSAQGRYSFPQKAYEILACQTPLVAAAVGTMKDLLKPYPTALFEPEDPTSLVAAIRSQLQNPAPIDIRVSTWRQSAERLGSFFQEVLDEEHGR